MDNCTIEYLRQIKSLLISCEKMMKNCTHREKKLSNYVIYPEMKESRNRSRIDFPVAK